MKWIYYATIALLGVIGDVNGHYFLNGCLCFGIFMLCICQHLEKLKDENH